MDSRLDDDGRGVGIYIRDSPYCLQTISSSCNIDEDSQYSNLFQYGWDGFNFGATPVVLAEIVSRSLLPLTSKLIILTFPIEEGIGGRIFVLTW